MADSTDQESRSTHDGPLHSTSISLPDINKEEKDQKSSSNVARNGETHGAESDANPNLVGWEDGNDKENPMNWPEPKKWGMIILLAFITFLTPLASSMFAPGIPQVMEEFGSTSNTLATFLVSIFVLGFAFGPLLMAPMSEIYGRLPVYNICNVLFVIFTILSAAATNMGMLLAVRFLAGVAGVAVITCGGGSISDMMPPEKRGRAMAIWSVGPILGPMIGPVVGGFLCESKGWRWVFWVLTILSGVVTMAAFFLLRETYAPVLLARKVARLRKETGNTALCSKLDTGLSEKDVFLHSIIRPVKMFIFSPIVTMMCVYIAVAYGLLYILFTTFTFVFRDQYGFNSSMAGLSFLGSGLGTVAGLAYAGTLSDRSIRLVIKAGRQPRPEDRLPPIITFPAALAIPAGLFIYGWGADKRVHWIVPEIGTAVTGFGMIGIVMCVQTYLIDAFTSHSASVIAASAVLRSLFGALFPLFGLNLYDKLGLGWGNSLLGFIALALAIVPWGFWLYGERIRTKPKWQTKF
ncbi:hypothetical protein V500_02905 [Pseudogymnoascus sp. VKM F-4518 (FW-2643)]|nr:hypothetical protein V500_02905 [Pseudogymnoascus sp. VKM F-4518 (FW-2643)]